MSNFLIRYYSKAHFFFMCCLMIFPIVPRGIHSSIMIIVTVMALFFFFSKGREDWTREKTKYLLSLGSIFLIYCISLLHMGDIDTGLKYVTRTAPVILIPFSFLTLENKEWSVKQLKIFLYIYAIAVSCALISLHYNFFEEIHLLEITSWEKRCRIEESIDIHGTYLSLWIGMAILSVQWLFFELKVYKKRFMVFAVLIVGYFLFWQYFLGARMPLFASCI